MPSHTKAERAKKRAAREADRRNRPNLDRNRAPLRLPKDKERFRKV